MSGDHIAKTIEVYDKVAPSYHRQSLDHGPVEERSRFMSMLPPLAKVLDVACGSGRDTNVFVKNGYKATGIDLSFELLSIAKEKVPDATFYQQDMRALRFPDASFDGIWACAALVHLKRHEVPEVLERLTRLLVRGGIAYFQQKHGEGEGFRVEKSVPGMERYYSYFSLDEFTGLVTTAGLNVFDSYLRKTKRADQESTCDDWIVCFVRK